MFFARARVSGAPCAFIAIPRKGLQALLDGPNLAILDGWNGSPLGLDGARVVSVMRADTREEFMSMLQEMGAKDIEAHAPTPGLMDAVSS